MTAVGTTSGSQSAARIPSGFQLGEYRVGQPLWPLRIAHAYRAQGPQGPVTIFVVHSSIAANPAVREHIINGTRSAAALGEQKHLVRTIAAGLTGEILWIATEEVEGSLVRELLMKKRTAATRAGNAGLGSRATGNLIAGVCAALADAPHGALADESVAVNRAGRVRVIDLALGPGTHAAILAGLVPAPSSMAPELLSGGAPNAASDVYAIGAMLYECLVGEPLQRGGPRPSEVVSGMKPQIDEVVSRACHRDPTKRFSRPDVLGEVVTEALNQGGAMKTTAAPLLMNAETLDQQVSLAAEIATSPPSASGNGELDHALAAALADTTEKWLISKGRLDYGPFSLADVIAQIEKGEIVAGNIIMDKDTGARVDVGEHPLLGPMVEAARQRLDDQRRAAAEVAVQKQEKQRGVMLYVMIGLGVVVAGLAVAVIIKATRGDEGPKQVAALEDLGGAELKVKVSVPKVPKREPRAGGQRGPGKRTGGGINNGSEDLSLDMSDESDDGGAGSLDMNVVYGVYSRYGAQLGGCLARGGGGSANIYMNIDGPSGKVKFLKINGEQKGELYACMSRVMNKMQFPTLKGGRTRVEFDIGL
ncbi:MAG: hypothetical protein AB7P03_12835 [Kofleriaceae bacterium]